MADRRAAVAAGGAGGAGASGAAAGPAQGGAADPKVPDTSAAGARPAELTDLEAAIHAASRRLAELHETNQQLARRIGELEAQLAGRGNAETGASESGQAAVALESERLEVRRRVEALARRLDQLAAAG